MLPAGFYINEKKKVTPWKLAHLSDWQQRKRTPKRQKIPIWCQVADVFQTISNDNVDNSRLRELVGQFNLNGNLLASQ
jgi:hypothetical protein